MRIKLRDGDTIDAAVEELDGELVIVLADGSVRIDPGRAAADGLELLDADEYELEALVAGGYGRALAGLDALLKASGAKLWSVQNAVTGLERGTYRAHTRALACTACIGDGQGHDADLFAELIDEG